MRAGAPTLLVFTLGSRAENARRALLPRSQAPVEAEVWHECLSAAVEAGYAHGCQVEVCSPSALPLPAGARHVPQEGAGFGERLEDAVRGAFARGAGSLLVVGTDVPGLAERHLGRALDLLAADPDRVVLGPSPDGGFYLLAAARPIDGLADATRWCRRDTLRGLLRALRAAGRPVVLLEDPLRDLDTRADLEAWLAERPGRSARWRRLARLLQSLLAGLRDPQRPSALGLPRPALAGPAAGRAPPSSPLSR